MLRLRKIPFFLLFAFIILAVAVRIAIFFQQRDLFIDEANVARNLYEKSYIELMGVLDYEQYATPIFLWFSKLSTDVFGFNELSLRLFPFICSILSVILLVYLISLLLDKKNAIYPLALFAGGFIFLHYSTELKQYSSDFLVSMILLIAALKTSRRTINLSFVLLWIILGSLAVWLSMPSVFILFSIGFFWSIRAYFLQNYKDLAAYLIAPTIWLVQFALYYFLLLKDQASSDYLQNYHANSFLILSMSPDSIKHNFKLFIDIIAQAGGHTFVAILFNTLLIILGFISIIRKKKWESLLFIIPFFVLFIASFLNKYALVPRLLMFIQPIVLVLLAFGIYTVFKTRNVVLKAILVIVMAFNIYNHQMLKFIFTKFEYQEISFALKTIKTQLNKDNNIPVLVFHGAKPSFIFYTEMHDKHSIYTKVKEQAKLLNWDSNYKSEVENLKTGQHFFVIFGSFYPLDLEKVKHQLIENELLSETKAYGALLLEYKKK